MGIAQTVCLRMPLPLASWQDGLITAGLAAYIGTMIWWLRRLVIHHRPWWAFLVSLVFVSPLPVTIIAWAVEGRAPWTLLNFDRQSWALLFGDAALAALIGWCAHAWKFLPLDMQVHYKRGAPSRPGHSWRPNWLLISLFWGILLAAAFRWSESGVYDLDRFMSYTKLFHDLVSYIVLATMVIFAAWPVLRRRLTTVSIWHDMIAKLMVLVLLGIWVLGGVHDARHGLDPAFLHPKRPTAEQFDPKPTDVLARNACKIPGR